MRPSLRGVVVWLMLLAVAGGVATCSAVAAEGFAIRDGDTVVFLGDSITAARTYGKIVENYTLLRFPERKVRFVNAGFGGDTAAGGLKRLERDVFQQGATLLTVAYGLNDIGWGVYADDEHKQRYLDSIRDIVAECVRRGVRVYICSAAVTAEDPAKSETGYLQRMCDEALALARSGGGQTIDVQRGMREIQSRVWAVNAAVKEEKQKTTLHAADGAHLNDLGQLAMAYTILKGLGAPAEVSSATLDAAEGKLIEAAGCQISDVKRNAERLEFTRLDAGLPFNYGLFYALNFRFVPVHDQLNRYQLCIKNLPEGRYDVTADGRGVSDFTAGQLAQGVNISSSTTSGWQPGGPWNAQANSLQSLTDARHHLAAGLLLSGLYLPDSQSTAELVRQAAPANEQLEALQHTAAKPRPYRFVIEKASEAERKPK